EDPTITPGDTEATTKVFLQDIVDYLKQKNADVETMSQAAAFLNPLPATVNLANLSQIFDGSAKAVTVTTTPANLPVSVSYNGTSTAPTDAGSYSVVANVTDPAYSGSANGTLVINKANQTITFPALADKLVSDADFTVSATSTSGLAVSFAASGPCTILASTVHITGTGQCSITASQACDNNYNVAADITQSFNISINKV